MQILRTAVLLALLGLNGFVPEANAGALRDSVSGMLVRADGDRFRAYRWEREPDTILLYFGAAWCASCGELEPALAAIRRELRMAGISTEVVFVSLDRTEGDMLRHMNRARADWPAIDFRRLRMSPAIRALAGAGTPNLVLVDREDRILASAWRGATYTGTGPVLRRWTEYLGSPGFAVHNSPDAPGKPADP